MWLLLVLTLPLLGALVVGLLPREDETQSRNVGLIFSILTFVISLVLLAKFDLHQAGLQLGIHVPWVKSLGIDFHIALDGISLWLVLLTTFLSPLVILSTFKSIQKRVKELIICLLFLEVGIIGAFIALDLFLFYIFWEIMLVPMYLIIGIWGHERRIFAAIKFVIYTLFGSILMLVAIIYMYLTHGQATGVYTFDYLQLSQVVWPQFTQHFLFLAFALAFAIKVPMFPFHTWLPDAHVEAPTAGSVILAGVLLKLGTYGFLRFAIPLFPWAAATYAPYIAILAVVGIVYGALVAWVQKDAKKLVAYSSVSHLGFVMLGLMTMSVTGIQGGILQMLNHGLSTGGLFLAIGVLYDRRHTHLLSQFGGLWKQMPLFGGLFLIVLMSSAGLPGLNGFVGEFLILVSSFTHYQDMAATNMPVIFIWHARVLTFVAATGLILGAVYLLHLFQKLMFGPLTHHLNRELPDVTPREIATFLPLIVFIIGMGIYPKPFLERMQPTVENYLKEYKTRFEASRAYPGSSSQPKRLSSLKPAVAPGEQAPVVKPRGRGDQGSLTIERVRRGRGGK